jgi:hypothetical protein
MCAARSCRPRGTRLVQWPGDSDGRRVRCVPSASIDRRGARVVSVSGRRSREPECRAAQTHAGHARTGLGSRRSGRPTFHCHGLGWVRSRADSQARFVPPHRPAQSGTGASASVKSGEREPSPHREAAHLSKRHALIGHQPAVLRIRCLWRGVITMGRRAPVGCVRAFGVLELPFGVLEVAWIGSAQSAAHPSDDLSAKVRRRG